MENSFSTNLRMLRKNRGITQEQLADAVGISPQAVSKWETSSYPDAQLLPAVADFLGVTIDELFGRKQEEPGLHDRIIRHLGQFSEEEYFGEAFELCRAVGLAVISPTGKYEPLSDSISEQLNHECYTQITRQDGWLQVRNSDDLQYFLLVPEPEEGYDKVLAYEEKYAEFFSFLAIPNALRAMYFLAGQPNSLFFTSDTLVHELGIDRENALQIIEGMLKHSLIWEATLNSGQGSGKIYQYLADCNFVSFMAFTRTLLNRPRNFYTQISDRSTPYFRNSTYKNQ